MSERTPDGRRILPHVEIFGDSPVPAVIPEGAITVAKIPGGEFHNINVRGNILIGDLFKTAQINVEGCKRIQKNGEDVTLEDYAGPGDEVYAYTNPRGN